MPTYEDLLLDYNYTGIPSGTVQVLPITQTNGLYDITYTVLKTPQDAIDTGYYTDDIENSFIATGYKQNVEDAFVNIMQGNFGIYSALFQDVANINFAEASIGTGIIAIGQYDFNSLQDVGLATSAFVDTGISSSGGAAQHGDIFINANHSNLLGLPGSYNVWDHDLQIVPGTAAFKILMEEISHSLGGDIQGTALTGTEFDSHKYTVTSYNSHPDMDYDGVGSDLFLNDATGPYSLGLGLYDIAALQAIYGTNTTTRNEELEFDDGDTNTTGTTYGIGKGFGATANEAFVYTIWDAGGMTDTIDATGYNNGVQIDLREGHFSSIGKRGDLFGNPVVWDSPGYDAGNVAIAYGTAIENAIGTAYADNIIGNALGNVITGGAGNDTLDGKGGADIYVYNLGDGHDVIDEASYENDIINLGGSIAAGAFDVTTTNDDVVLTFSDNGTLTIKNAALDSVDLGFVYEDSNNQGQTVAGDLFVGTSNNDSLANSNFSFSYNDPVIAFGKSGDDTIGGSSGDDVLYGGSGNDYLGNVNGGNDIIDGGSGNDRIIVASSNVDGQETYVYGGSGDDDVTVAWRSSFNDFYLDDISGDDTYSLSSNGYTSIHVTDSSGSDFYYHATVNNSLIEITDSAGSDVYRLAPIKTGSFIIDDQGGTDELRFGMNYSVFNGTSQSGNDLNVHTTLGGSFTIKDYYLSSLHVTELVSFNDTDIFDIDLLINASDAVIGTNSDDITLNGNANDNTILGFGGDDTLTGGAGNDTLDGGADVDTANYAGATVGIVASLHTGSTSNDGDGGVDALISIENITGSIYADIITGSDGANVIITGDGGDIVQARAGDDVITGGAGADVLYGGNDNDTIYAGAGDDSDIRGENGDDILFGEAGNDTLRGGFGNDTLNGGDDSDTLIGNENDDTFIASSGDDAIDGGTGIDIIDYSGWALGLTVNLFNGTVDKDGDTITDDTITAVENFIGTDYDDVITGSEGENTIHGGGGNDLVYARAGTDILYGDDGNDIIYGVEGDDVLYGGAGVDTLRGQGGADTFVFESASAFDGSIDTIQDFSTAQNDALDIADLLSGYDPLADAISDFVQITDNGTHSYVAVDVDGGADNFVQIAQMSNVTGLTDEDLLETNGNLITV